MYKRLIFLFILTSSLSLSAQDITPRGKFLSDTVKVGEQFHYTLAARYPWQLDIIFPDSTFDYLPFEFIAKKYFPTQTDSMYSYDSVVYTLTTFEIDTVQYLRLPVFNVTEGDSLARYAPVDSIVLFHVVKEIPDTLQVEEIPLKENTSYIPLNLQFNYPYLIIGIVIFIIIVLLILIIFGKSIRRWWKLRNINRRHRKFIHNYQEVIEKSDLTDEEKALKASVTWRRYMEKLTGVPFTKLTTKEILMHDNNEELKGALQQIDRVIYSNRRIDADLTVAYLELENYSEHQYLRKVEEVKNG